LSERLATVFGYRVGGTVAGGNDDRTLTESLTGGSVTVEFGRYRNVRLDGFQPSKLSCASL